MEEFPWKLACLLTWVFLIGMWIGLAVGVKANDKDEDET